jgi:hypothetical protein
MQKYEVNQDMKMRFMDSMKGLLSNLLPQPRAGNADGEDSLVDEEEIKLLRDRGP